MTTKKLEKDPLAIINRVGVRDDLGFDKNDFLKENFSVDEFLHKNRGVPSLEQLRDNLGIYLKGLRAAMIDLINEDYADFINLSANLEGLDQNIALIKQPVDQSVQELKCLYEQLQVYILQLNTKTNQTLKLQQLQRMLQSLKKVYIICEQLENLLAEPPQQSELDIGLHLERAAIQLSQLQNHVRLAQFYLTPELQLKHAQITETVYAHLREFFLNSLKEPKSVNTESLERALSIYTTLDAEHVAEEEFRKNIVAPYLNGIMTEQSLQNCPQGLAGIYGRILNFLSLHMPDILRLTSYTDKFVGFNFSVNSFWAEVTMRLENDLSSIFAPGNADIFYAQFTCTRDFTLKIKELLNPKEFFEFKEHKQTLSFKQRWNLPVYYQIRFQEIAGEFESTLQPLIDENTVNISSKVEDEYQIVPIRIAKKAIERCWADGVYLPEILNKFVKLNMQILSRLHRYIKDLMSHIIDSNTQVKIGKSIFLVIFYADLEKFTNHLQAIKTHVLKLVSNTPDSNEVTVFIAELYEHTIDSLKQSIIGVSKVLVDVLLIECGSTEQLRFVNDLPRLYRKTNRDIPTRCSNYVEQLLRPIKKFSTQHADKLDAVVLSRILTQLSSNLTNDYFAAVSEVLISVQKTEESLRRLRNLKTSTVAATNTVGITDDDKIRLQLRVDVSTWKTELEKLHLFSNEIEKLQELENIVEESIKSKQ